MWVTASTIGRLRSFEDNLSLSFGFTITDGDNDKASGTLTVNVDDDSPSLVNGAAASVTVDEDDLNNLGGDSGNFYLFDIIEGSAGSSPQAPGTDTTDYQQTHGFLLGGMLNRMFNGSVVGNGSLSNVVNFGADGANSAGGFQLNSNALGTLASQGLKSQGDAVSFASINSDEAEQPAPTDKPAAKCAARPMRIEIGCKGGRVLKVEANIAPDVLKALIRSVEEA